VVVALLAGGAGGYLIRGATTLATNQATSTSVERAQPVTGPLTEPHDSIPTVGNGAAAQRPGRDSQSGYGAPSQTRAASGGLNSDSTGGY